MLRGVNLSGSSKLPVNHDIDVFPAEHQTVTFVGRPSLWRKPMIISLGYNDGDLPSVYLAST
ncbi:hypothetical protein EV421DRAFT_1806542 [Armillaria borealis]|uniref:Uncharacterized protein n=1 Tax=Armillaria borealis TaxID=47425 RepID=A0AA39JHR5_9AGAR|nr:hypothetical protein EV421DRAFT_1806542 [Armillaria borealis]